MHTNRLEALGLENGLDATDPTVVTNETRAACDMLSDIQSALEMVWLLSIVESMA